MEPNIDITNPACQKMVVTEVSEYGAMHYNSTESTFVVFDKFLGLSFHISKGALRIKWEYTCKAFSTIYDLSLIHI